MNDFNNLNLEYLRVLNSILSTRSTTISARNLGVTQSAVSHSLKRLRDVLKDEIVFRQGNSMELTAKAQAIKVPLQKWLEQLDPILNIAEFNPKTSTRVFYIATTDIMEHLVVPKIIRVLRKEAPKIQLRVLRWDFPKVEEQLLNSQVDLAIGVRTFDSPNILQRVLYNDTFTSAARKGHPIHTGKATIEKFLSYPHVMTGPGDGRGAIDNYLEKLNRKRELLYTVNSFSSAPALIENSDCILTAPQRFLKYIEKKYKVQEFQIPIEINQFSLKIYWAKKHHNDSANKWMRDLFYDQAQ